MHKTIEVPSEQIRLIFGHQDAHLRQIQRAIPVTITATGNEIHIGGEQRSQVAYASEVIGELQRTVKNRHQLTEKEVEQVLKNRAPLPPPDVDEAGQPHLTPIQAGSIVPQTRGQARYMHAIRDNDLVFCAGPAGSGKTFLAVAMALEALRREEIRKIVLVRPAVEAGEKLGFLPGDMLAKVNPFIRPLLDALRDMLDFETVQRYMEHDVIEIVPLAFMRGRTLNETFMILDEAQNSTITQMKMFLTRMGNGSRIVITGDLTQNDLPAHVPSGLTDAMTRLKGIPGIATIHLDGRDIVRHRLVREIVKAYDTNTENGVSSK
ncbi:MAG: PhoH family protein [Planctomycetaceae bacterium]|nr:PhoH family protein [Planctomycetaceae bacterium]